MPDDFLFSRRRLLKSAAYSAAPLVLPALGRAQNQQLQPRVPRSQLGIAQLSNAEMNWLLDAKFGMFIHWGLYAGPGRGEWMMHSEAVPPEEYRTLATDRMSPDYFLADEFDPSAWAEIAKRAGMRWMCLTARHHDGFCLFKSPHPNAFSSYVTHGRDFVEEYVKAVRAAHLKVGLYFSPINWRYPGYYDVTGTDCKPNPFGYKTSPKHKENARLMKEENYANVRRLMTEYGRIDHVFWDGGWLGEHGSDADAAYFHEPGLTMSPENPWPVDPRYLELNADGQPLGIMGLTRKHQPHAVVNPRYGWIGDYMDEEGGAEVSGPVRSADIYQKCMTTAGAWGYDRQAVESGQVLKPAEILEMLVNCVVRDMVLLLNVGPDRHGMIPPPVASSLADVGDWLKVAGSAIYGTRGGPWNPVDRKVGYCYRGNTVYVHLMKEWSGSEMVLPSLAGRRPVRAYDVASGRMLAIQGQRVEAPSGPRAVAAVEYDGPVR